MVRGVLSLMALFLLGCATPSGTYRDYFGFDAASREQSRDELQTASREERQTESRQSLPQESTVGRREAASVVVVSPAWYPDWYAPWCACLAPGAPWWWEYRWWYSSPYRSWCHPWYYPPVVVVIPVETQPAPPMRVRTFGPARGNPERASEEVLQGDAGGGRARGRTSTDRAAQRTEKPAELQVSTREKSGGDRSDSGGGRQRSTFSTDETESGSGGGRSRGTPP